MKLRAVFIISLLGRTSLSYAAENSKENPRVSSSIPYELGDDTVKLGTDEPHGTSTSNPPD